MAGTGGESTDICVRLTKRAAHIGATAAIVITPCYFKAAMKPAALIRHYRTVADASPIPIILYNFPANTGINLEPETVARWRRRETRAALHPGIGAYSTARDLGRFYQSWLDDGAMPDGGRLLSPATVRRARLHHAVVTPTFGFGYGFMMGTDPALPLSRGVLCSPRTFGHPGMCSAQAWADPDTGLVAVLFEPLRRRLQRGVNRLLYGERDEPYVALSTFVRGYPARKGAAG